MGGLDGYENCYDIVLQPSIVIPLGGKEALSSRFSPDGTWLAVGNISGTIEVRVYDGQRCVLTQTLCEGDGIKTAGHSNRVFAVRWHPTDAHVCLSGGWDSTVQIWDTRVGRSVRSIFGPKLCGDSLDICETTNRVLTGSWRTSNQLQEWDYRSGTLIATFQWPQNRNTEQQCKLYSARYGCGSSHNLIAAGGSGRNEACLFHTRTGQLIGGLFHLKRAVNSTCWSPAGDRLAITIADVVFIIDTLEFCKPSR